jgi:cellobiose phosphorylase
VNRRFRGASYEITVKNQSGVCCGVKEITLDGSPLEGNIVPFSPGDHKVVVVL